MNSFLFLFALMVSPVLFSAEELYLNPAGKLYSARRHDATWNPEGVTLHSNVDKNEWKFRWVGGTIPNNSCRMAEELRCGVYLSIAHRFVGNIIHMGHGFLPEERTRGWSLLSGILAEIQAFYPAFSKGEELSGFVTKTQEGHFFHKAVDTGDSILVMVVNTSPVESSLEMSVKANRMKHPGSATLSNGVIKDTFTPYEPKI